MLAVVLALLVLLCAGVISFLYKQGKTWAAVPQRRVRQRGRRPHGRLRRGTAGGVVPSKQQAGATPGWIRANEGRQTL